MESPLIYLTAVFVLGIAAQWLAWRFKLPAILLLLGFGMLAGWRFSPERFLEENLLFSIVSLSVAVILFEGGLSLRFRELRETKQVVWRLISVGCIITWALAMLASLLVFDHPGVAALAGAIYVVTGPTVIGPLLRHVRPIRRVGSVAKWEGIVIDPIGAMLAVLVFAAVAAGGVQEAAFGIATALIVTILVSAGLGAIAALLLIQLLQRHWVPDYLHNPVVLAVVLAVFTASNLVQPESGLATVTLVGIILANQRSITIAHLIEFKENLGVLLISALFILLGSRIQIGRMLELGWPGLAFLALLVVGIRPLAVFSATIGTSLNWRERTFLACLAPRGIVAAAVSSVFALELSHLAGRQEIGGQLAADVRLLVPLTFLVIIGTVAIYGLAAAPLARWLRIADPSPQGVLFAGGDAFVREIAKVLRDENYPVLIIDTDRGNVAAAHLEGLPAMHGSIVSDYVLEQTEIGGIGKLLAMTANDEVNSLAVLQWTEVFDRANVYQLPPEQRDTARHEPLSPALRGRYLFGPDVTHARLERLVAEGAKVKKTRLTEEFDFADYKRRYDGTAVLLFVIDPLGKLIVWTEERNSTEPAPGSTLISLVEPSADQIA